METINYYDEGYKLGQASGSWVFDGNTNHETYEQVRKGYDEGDPEVMDLCPNPLSGEWSGESIPEIFGLNTGDMWPNDDDLEAFEWGFGTGFWDTVLKACAYQLDNVARV